MATTKSKKNLKPNVVSFRLTTPEFKLLTAIFNNEPMSYVKSENHLARKIVRDFINGRLTYTNPAHRELDVDAHAQAAAAAA